MKNYCLTIFSSASLLFVFMTAAQVFAQEKTVSTERIRELNRSGQWAEAAALADIFLGTNQTNSNKENCQALQSLIYAQTKLNRTSKAQAAQRNYDQLCRAGELAPDANLKMSKPTKSIKDDFWQTEEPAEVGVSATILTAHQDLCERTGADACLVIKRGKIVQEIYSDRYRLPMMAMSSTKSVIGILVGMLIDDGKIKSLDEPVCHYVKQWCAGEKSKVTLRHLLSMTPGLPRKHDNGVGSVSDKNSYVIAEPLVFEPGKTWNYSNEGVQLLSPILDKAAGEPIQDYARRRLFEPLGMRDTKLHLDAKGRAWTYADMETSARDFARIGILMLNQGMWGNKRIVSRKWIEASVRPSQTLNSGYGLLWYVYEKPKGFGAQGYLDTNLYAFPEADLLIIRMQSKPIDKQIWYEAEAFKLFDQMIQK